MVAHPHVTVANTSGPVVAVYPRHSIQDPDLLFYTSNRVQGCPIGKLTTLKYAVQVWQVCNLHHIALQQSFWRNKVFPHRWEQDVLYLPPVRVDSTLILIQARGLRLSDRRARHIEESELSQQGPKAFLFRRPVHLSLTVRVCPYYQYVPSSPAARDALKIEEACRGSVYNCEAAAVMSPDSHESQSSRQSTLRASPLSKPGYQR